VEHFCPLRSGQQVKDDCQIPVKKDFPDCANKISVCPLGISIIYYIQVCGVKKLQGAQGFLTVKSCAPSTYIKHNIWKKEFFPVVHRIKLATCGTEALLEHSPVHVELD